MKDISLRVAKLDDFDMYFKFYCDYDAQFLYASHASDANEDAQKMIDEIGIVLTDETKDIIKANYRDFLKGIYFINVNQAAVGYVKTEKSKGDVIIRDMVISDYSILNERQLSILFNYLFKATKAHSMIIYFCGDTNAKLLQRIGFEKHVGHLKKTAGI